MSSQEKGRSMLLQSLSLSLCLSGCVKTKVQNFLEESKIAAKVEVEKGVQVESRRNNCLIFQTIVEEGVYQTL